MDDELRSLLVRGIAAAKADDREEARYYLNWLLRKNPTLEYRVEASYWMSQISEDPQEKRNWLEDVLALNPWDPRARRAMALLEGKLAPEELVDPENLPIPHENGPATARRFDCPNCGGRMTYSADGYSLLCEYCELKGRGAGEVELVGSQGERDFILALATAKGHLHRETARSFTCGACGANYILAPEAMSITCAHCGSAYVVEVTEPRLWIQPQGVIPFRVAQVAAHRAILQWAGRNGLRSPSTRTHPPYGLYFPAWTFDIGGFIRWRGLEYDDDQIMPQTVTGREPVAIDDLLVPANRELDPLIERELDHYDLKGLVPYDPSYLADWPAETYEQPLSDVALEARQRAFNGLRKEVLRVVRVRDPVLSSSDMAIHSYKLILLPVWLGEVHQGEASNKVIVNGQNGRVRGEERGGRGIVGRLFRGL